MITVGFVITCFYSLLIIFFVFGFNRVSPFKLDGMPPKNKFSVIIPFRDEAINLPSLLKTIETLKYSKDFFEIIFVDDGSADNSVEIIKAGLSVSKINFSIISNQRTTNSPKKDAITLAITRAKYDWIITTDADCELPEFWLEGFDECIQKNKVVCIVAPVIYRNAKSFLNQFQVLDFLSLQGVTIGGFGIDIPFLCNGANLAYKKETFINVGGFDGNANIASGDDIFLLEKIHKKHPKALKYLKGEAAIVLTKSQPTWETLIAQRVRWAAKTSSYNSWFGKLTGLVVLLMNMLIVVGWLLSCIGVLSVRLFCCSVFVKCCVDALLLYKSAVFFKQKAILKAYILGFVIYPFFSVYVVIVSIFKGYTWKGRHFKK